MGVAHQHIAILIDSDAQWALSTELPVAQPLSAEDQQLIAIPVKFLDAAVERVADVNIVLVVSTDGLRAVEFCHGRAGPGFPCVVDPPDLPNQVSVGVQLQYAMISRVGHKKVPRAVGCQRLGPAEGIVAAPSFRGAPSG